MAEPETPRSYLDLGGSFLEDLPSSIERYPYEGESSFLRIFNQELNPRESSGYGKDDFILLHMNREMIEALFNPDNEPTTLISNCSSFYLDEQLILIKMPSAPHSAASNAMEDAIAAALIPMGLFGRLHKYSNMIIRGTRRGKQSNHGWGPKKPPPGYPKRPSVVLEVAVEKHEPAIRIEKWRLQNGRPHRSQIIRVTKVSDQIIVTNHPLIIPFEDLFLRPPSILVERQIEISQQALQGITEAIWDFQEF
ncbi:hypothetical protein N7463_009856 [Penicillium fimorum]|uniref:Uncharacterized protein n=1 Tax=Penicillium fimorum TaxID=1882269 RepID=A0A9W9XIX7_9EURO|nr:hypothetical protein N7463_009856 [Penicillium fimorum]